MVATALTIGAAQEQARQALKGMSDSPGQQAQLILADLLDSPRAWILAHPEFILGEADKRSFGVALARLTNGEPLPYVLGWWEFYGRRFRLAPSVLIPRPESELLVEKALERLKLTPPPVKIVDVGTGSGCLGVTLAAEVPDIRLAVTDVSLETLHVARRNAREYGVDGRISFVQADLLEPLAGPFDLVVANLPYVPSSALRGMPAGRREPGLALDGGRDGLELTGRLLHSLPGKLSPTGAAFLEIGADQGTAVQSAAKAALPDADVQITRDLAGHDRVIEIRCGAHA